MRLEKKDCELCGGTGVVPTDVLDRDSMQYMRGVGCEPCECTKTTQDEELMDDDSESL